MNPQFVTFKGIDVCYTDSGRGKSVVFLHGFLGDQTIWDYYVKQLASSSYRTITIDLLGHGRSACLSYVHTMEEMAEAVKKVLASLKIRKYFLVGHSMGGYVSLALAEQYPDEIRGLCLFHSTARADRKEKQQDRVRAAKVVKRNKTMFIDEAIPKLFYVDEKKKNIRGITKAKKLAHGTSMQGILAALEGMKIRLDREIVLKFAPYPVFYIIGKEDGVLPFEELKNQAEGAQFGSFEVLENVGHMGFFEAKRRCLELIKTFISH